MKWNFQGWPRKNNVEFPGVFVFGLGVSKGSNTILWNIQGLSFVLSGISRCKVKNEQFQGCLWKSISSTPLFGFFLELPNVCVKLNLYYFYKNIVYRYLFAYIDIASLIIWYKIILSLNMVSRLKLFQFI